MTKSKGAVKMNTKVAVLKSQWQRKQMMKNGIVTGKIILK